MKLHTICESDSQLEVTLNKILPNHGAKNKLISWAMSKNEFTNPSDVHTSAIIRDELSRSIRLVGNPWKDNVIYSDLKGLYVLDYNKQLMVSLPNNQDVVDYVVNTSGAAIHAVRGLAFGYEPKSVLEFYSDRNSSKMWVNFLHRNGVKVSSDYGNRGYASGIMKKDDKIFGLVIIEPSDIKQLRPISKSFKLHKLIRWCPECYNYVHIKGEKTDGDLIESECQHKPISTPDKPGDERHWYSFEFIMSKKELNQIMNLVQF